ncbi:MAG: TolC family protein [Prevotella sp.]|nr:TolC family protein [Prevotella sp.]
MKKGLIMTAALLLTATSTWAQKQWTLQQCIDYAMQNNITLQKAKLKNESAQEDVKESKAALLPSLSASTNHSVGYSPWLDNGVMTVTNNQVNSSVEKTYYNGSYGLNAQWTVWNGNKNVNTIKQNKLTAEQADLQTQVTANSIQEQIAQLYVQILYLTEAVKVSEQSLETSRKNEERGKEMLEVGKMSKADVAQLSAQRATDEYNIVESRANISKYKLQLKQLLELDGTEQFDIVVPATTDEQALATIPALQSVYDQALTTRPEIKSGALAVESSDLSITMAKAGWLPTLSMTAGAGTSTNSRSSNSFGSQLKTNFDLTGGLTLSIPIFDRRQTKTAVNKARLQYETAKLDLLDEQKQLYQTIEQYWLDAETNQQKFRAAQATEQSEQESFDLLQEQFRLGLKNIVELMTGKDKLLTAQQNKLQSKYQTILAQQMLRFYQGGSLN